MSRHHKCPPAPALEWAEDGTPASLEFGDVYFSREDGLAESRHVFIDGNRLSERWQALLPGQEFTLAESGFGTGLNFLAAARHFLENAAQGSFLHYLSFECFPMSCDQIGKALSHWKTHFPELTEDLLIQYPLPVAGVHRLVLASGRIQLTLYWGTFEEGIKALHFRANAWFLDGFAPAKNPDMWRENLAPLIWQSSHPGATLATFTAAGAVRRTLQEAGWSVQRQPGYGRKRHMVTGTRSEAQDTDRSASESDRPLRGNCLVVGSGLAGCTTAFFLTQRGYKVTLIESGDQIAAGASGNPRGALYINPGIEWSPQTRLHVTAYLFALRFYQNLLKLPEDLACFDGLINLAHTEREAARQQRLLTANEFPAPLLQALSVTECQALAGFPLASGGLLFPQGGWMAPSRLCGFLCDQAGLDLRLNTSLRAIQQASTPNGRSGPRPWHTRLNDRDEVFDQVVYCTGKPAPLPGPEDTVTPPPAKAIRGQISCYRIPEQAAFPKLPLCGDGYVIPQPESRSLWVGASFQPGDADTELRPSCDEENWLRWQQISGQDQSLDRQALQQSRASLRYALPDYMPACGSLHGQEQFRGLWYLGALGSKGLTLAPLLASTLVDLISGTPAPLDRDLLSRLDPTRFGGQRT